MHALIIEDESIIAMSIEDILADCGFSTELVINALKHAFPGRNQKGQIEVDYSSSDEGWTLTVGDDGDGMAAESDAKPGLGTGIVEALAKQLDATVEVADQSPGTKVTVAHVSGAEAV